MRKVVHDRERAVKLREEAMDGAEERVRRMQYDHDQTWTARSYALKARSRELSAWQAQLEIERDAIIEVGKMMNEGHIELEHVMNEGHGAVEQTPTVAACASPPRAKHDQLRPPAVAAPPLAVITKRKRGNVDERLEPLGRRHIPKLSRKCLRRYLSDMGGSTNGTPDELKERLTKFFALNDIDQGDDD